MNQKIKRILYSFRLIFYYKIFSDKNYINSKGWSYWVASAPWKIFIFMSSEFCYSKILIRFMYKKNAKSYWINLTSSEEKNQKNLINLWEVILKKNKFDYILVLSDGDVTIDINCYAVDKILKHKHCKRIYSQNLKDVLSCNPHKQKLKIIPIGFDFHSYRKNESPYTLHKYLKDYKEIKKSKETFLIDFKSSLSSPIRSQIIKYAINNENIDILQDRLSQRDVWMLYKQHLGVISPPGGGLDCHRTWEALFFGCNICVFTTEINDLFTGVDNIFQLENISDVSDLNFSRLNKLKINTSKYLTFTYYILDEDLGFFN